MAAAIARRGRAGQDDYSALGCWIGDPSESTLLPVGGAPRASAAQL
jgi:hypothetical protein